MRGLRSTTALVVVLAGLFAYIYFVTWKKPADGTASKQEKVFAGIQTDKIDELKITSDKGDVTTLKKEGGNWQLVAPASARADESQASGIVSALGQVEMTRVIDERAADLKQYGLETPRIEIDFKAAGDKDYRRLFIGDKAPTGGDLFARRNDDKKVFLIPSYQETTFNHSTFDLRDKIVLKFEPDKIDSLDVSAGGNTLQFTKDGSEWKITQPLPARADYASVEGLVGRLQSAAMKSIATESASPADLKKFGLDKPAASVDLKMGSARAIFQVGSKAETNTVYARDASRSVVVTVDNALADELKKDVNEYRRKDVFEFRAYNANRLEFTRNGQTVAFEKDKAQGNAVSDKWRRVSPNPADADKDKIESLLSRLSNMRIASFVDASVKTGLDMPAMTVYAKFDDAKKEERVSIGKVNNDVYVSRPGEHGAGKVDAADFTEASKTLDELAK